MPPKLSTSDYTFYLVRDDEGKYRFKDERVNVHRKRNAEFVTFIHALPENERRLIIELFGIANIQAVETGEYILVYEIFKDLRDEVVPIQRQTILIQHLLDENEQLKIAVEQLKKLLEDNNILIITPEMK